MLADFDCSSYKYDLYHKEISTNCGSIDLLLFLWKRTDNIINYQ